jgi:UDP-N-acetyl-D-glucosamine/UDP-N-acetyl-D-galactosamine dehydrogenase
MRLSSLKLAIIGLGYVGLPLAVEFAKKRLVIGYDIKKIRIQELKNGIDKTLEVSREQLLNSKNLRLTYQDNDLSSANCFIITVPTPVNKEKKPDLKLLINASNVVGRYLKKGDIVIYESTVYPGCTEEECVPILENSSRLKFNLDFFCGYSPERINPGDRKHRISDIIKITSGSTLETSNLIDLLYKEVALAGTYKASSIKVAEAAKVIENTQRDLNIALMNELSIIFSKMNINTKEVLEAAETKWNFLKFRPGLVGGHCIGVDPYYLTHKAKMLGYNPQVILAGRDLNDKMAEYVAEISIKLMVQKSIKINGSRILIMGLTFKENCPDLRNSGALNIIKKLNENGCVVDVYDPLATKEDIMDVYGKSPVETLVPKTYDCIIITVAHDKIKNIDFKFIKALGKDLNVICDLKQMYPKKLVDLQL